MPSLPALPSTITSPSHPWVKACVSLHKTKGRREHQACLVEGVNALTEAHQAGYSIEALFTPSNTTLPAWANSLPQCEVSEAVMHKLASTASAPPLAGIVSLPEPPTLHAWLDSVTEGPLLILDGLQDPGNVGTLLRSAVAFGVSGVLLFPPAVDPWGPKVIRSATGFQFRLPCITIENEQVKTSLDTLEKHGYSLILAGLEANTQQYSNFAWPTKSVLILGSEGNGPQALCRDAASHSVHIPMAKGVNSLNVAVSGSILLSAFRT